MAEKRGTIVRLSRTALFALVRGLSAAAGSALVGLAIWWLQHR
ncbi:hypothetical protein [Nonomuraea sp. SBT364]|nr:hypothetical protein [Nonomuraea sp. SBT364]